MTSASSEKENPPDFETATHRLEEIVRKLETGEAGLEQAIRLYEEGVSLKQYCEAKLETALARVEKIQMGVDQVPIGVVPFENADTPSK